MASKPDLRDWPTEGARRWSVEVPLTRPPVVVVRRGFVLVVLPKSARRRGRSGRRTCLKARACSRTRVRSPSGSTGRISSCSKRMSYRHFGQRIPSRSRSRCKNSRPRPGRDARRSSTTRRSLPRVSFGWCGCPGRVATFLVAVPVLLPLPFPVIWFPLTVRTPRRPGVAVPSAPRARNKPRFALST